MFRDWDWDDSRTVAQKARMDAWMKERQDEPFVVLDIGSGTAIPTCRLTAEQVAHQRRAPLVRLNPREPEMPQSLADAGGVSIAAGALGALEAIDAELEQGSMALIS